MTKQFTLLQLFSLLDDRLSTTMEDVYDMLNHICDEDLMTHHLPVALKYLREKNPWWFCNWKTQLETEIDTLCPIKERNKEQFLWIMSNMDLDKTVIDIPQLKDEFDTSDFGDFMVKNSLLR